jgi:hypothetical protein
MKAVFISAAMSIEGPDGAEAGAELPSFSGGSGVSLTWSACLSRVLYILLGISILGPDIGCNAGGRQALAATQDDCQHILFVDF